MVGEDFYHLGLDLPRTSIATISEQIQLPKFVDALGPWETVDAYRVQKLSAFYFLAKVSLQRVILSVHQTVQRCKYIVWTVKLESLTDYAPRS